MGAGGQGVGRQGGLTSGSSLLQADAPKRVIRGGSFLCNVDYCLSYRPSARRGSDPYNPMSHLGFRLVMSQEEWQRK
jgi:formylglycine-generating enzyme required for sulfatase activity